VNRYGQLIPRRVWLIAAACVVAALALVVIAGAVSRPSFRDGVRIPGPVAAAPAPLLPGKPFPGGLGHRGVGFASGGTITAINGSTLTLRTLQGTQTVTTSGSTQYSKARQTIAFSDLKVGDVVRVLPAAGAAKPASPGTGTVAAARIVVVEPTFVGRVESVDGDTVNLVGRNGQSLTVTLTDSTKYYNGAQTADRSAITAGTRIAAMGSQDTPSHLTADVVTVLPARAAGAWKGGPMPGAGPMWRWRGGPGGAGLPGPGDGFLRPGGFGA